MSIDVDKISMDDILKGFDRQAETVNVKEIDKFYRSKYPNLLDKYDFVKHKDLAGILRKGDIIKHSKKYSDELSSSCFIVAIYYLDDDKSVIDRILVSTYR